MKLIKQYASPTELDSILLNALVEKIAVHEAIKHEDGSREQEVEIFYKFVGKIDWEANIFKYVNGGIHLVKDTIWNNSHFSLQIIILSLLYQREMVS